MPDLLILAIIAAAMAIAIMTPVLVDRPSRARRGFAPAIWYFPSIKLQESEDGTYTFVPVPSGTLGAASLTFTPSDQPATPPATASPASKGGHGWPAGTYTFDKAVDFKLVDVDYDAFRNLFFGETEPSTTDPKGTT